MVYFKDADGPLLAGWMSEIRSLNEYSIHDLFMTVISGWVDIVKCPVCLSKYAQSHMWVDEVEMPCEHWQETENTD